MSNIHVWWMISCLYTRLPSVHLLIRVLTNFRLINRPRAYMYNLYIYNKSCYCVLLFCSLAMTCKWQIFMFAWNWPMRARLTFSLPSCRPAHAFLCLPSCLPDRLFARLSASLPVCRFFLCYFISLSSWVSSPVRITSRLSLSFSDSSVVYCLAFSLHFCEKAVDRMTDVSVCTLAAKTHFFKPRPKAKNN